ncbi:hypothetical protein JCM3766R1_004427 [Sporobolomyces carnicolor]
MYGATPPASPSGSSPPETPRSAVPLLLQPANRASRSPSRSSTFHYASSTYSAATHEPLPVVAHAPPLPRSASTSTTIAYRNGISFPAPPPLPLARPPFRHQRVASSVPRYALEDVVISSEMPALGYHGGYEDNRTFSESSTESSHEPKASGKEQKYIVNREGFLEAEEKPVRGFWSRWFRGMVILVVFLTIITGVAIGVSEYYDSKHRGKDTGELDIATPTASSTSYTSSTLPTTFFRTVTDSNIVEPGTSSRMRTVRTTSTAASAASATSNVPDRSSTTETTAPAHTTTATTATEAPRVTSTDAEDSDDTLNSGTTGRSEAILPTSGREDASDDVTVTSELPDSPQTTGRFFGLASATMAR